MKKTKFKMTGNGSGIEEVSESSCLCASVLKKDAGVVEGDFNTETQRRRGTEFKMTEIGPIPEDWDVKRLGDVCEINPRMEGEIPDQFIYVDLESVADGALIVKKKLLRAESPSRAQRRFRRGDVLFQTVRPYQRNNLLVDFDAEDYVASTGYAIIREIELLCVSEFIYHIVHMDNFVNDVMDRCTGTSYPAINPRKLAEIMICIPKNISEQKAIAEALSDVDELLVAITTLIEKKRAIKQGAMQELLGMRNGECGMRNVPRRRLPGFSGEWVEKRFDECFEFIGNNTYARECMCDDCDGLANIHYGDVLIRYGSVLDCSRTAIPSLINSIVCRTDRLSDGDVIIADTAEDETVGKAIEIRGLNGRRAVSGLHTIACRPRFDFAPGWLGYYINSSAFHDQLLPLITGTKVSSISRAGLRTTILNVPPLAEQQAIAAVLSDMDAEIAALEAKQAKYESIKQGMMQELLTGKTRLKGA